MSGSRKWVKQVCQAAVVLLRAAHNSRCSIHDPLQLVGNRLWCSGQQQIAIVKCTYIYVRTQRCYLRCCNTVHAVFMQHELKLDVPIQKHVVSTLRCFERALQLDDASGKLWIEYGSCAYLIHSHTSRLLKQVYFLSLLQLLNTLSMKDFQACFAVQCGSMVQFAGKTVWSIPGRLQ